jgi:hypothetical protein
MESFPTRKASDKKTDDPLGKALNGWRLQSLDAIRQPDFNLRRSHVRATSVAACATRTPRRSSEAERIGDPHLLVTHAVLNAMQLSVRWRTLASPASDGGVRRSAAELDLKHRRRWLLCFPGRQRCTRIQAVRAPREFGLGSSPSR